MYKKIPLHKIVNYIIATVWIVNGLFCKVLNLVPRHQFIVARILGDEYSGLATKAIGISEMVMAIWILSPIKSRWCAVSQIVIVGAMNIIEFFVAPDLLLFGKLNSLIALVFIVVVYFNEFTVSKKLTQHT